jgi:hypothetical protein
LPWIETRRRRRQRPREPVELEPLPLDLKRLEVVVELAPEAPLRLEADAREHAPLDQAPLAVVLRVAADERLEAREEAGRKESVAGVPADLAITDLRNESVVRPESRGEVVVADLPVPVPGGVLPLHRAAEPRVPFAVPSRV